MDLSFFHNLSLPYKLNLRSSLPFLHSPTTTPLPLAPKPQNPNPTPLNLPRLIQSLHSLISSWSPSSPPPRRRSPIANRFRPYVAKVPWHGGARGFLSQLFPRYGHYCGPNWSSGKDGGSLLWDKRPIDWLDLCCYCHDIGYDTHDQAELLKADLAFLECLERPRMPTAGDARTAYLYKSMCIYGLRNVLIPYRMQLVKLQGRQSIVEFMGSLIGKNPLWRQKADRVD